MTEKSDTSKISIVNNAIDQYSNKSGKKDIVDFPNNMMIEVTNACNLACDMCYHKYMKRKIGFISIELFTKTVQDAYDLGVRKLGLYTTGESFAHPKILELVKIAKKIGIEYVYITTNGQLIVNKIDAILESGLDSIKFSIDAAKEKNYEVMKIGGKWNTLVKNITELREKRDKLKSKLKIFASFLITEDNHLDLAIYKGTFGKLVDETIFGFIGNQGGQSDKDFISLLPDADKFGSLILPKEKWHPCELLWNRFIVTYDGKLTACCIDFEARLVYADLTKESLKDAWNNEKITRFRNIHKNGEFEKLPLCNSCEEVRTDYDLRNKIIKGFSEKYNN